MSAPPACVSSVRVAVRRALASFAAGDLVLVGCSGGADSLALLAATAFEAPRAGLRCGAVTVNHCWADGSAERARAVAETAERLGVHPVAVVDAPAGRTEGAARSARYAAFDAAIERHAASAVFLAHSLDDQAETVLLGLARGSGARSLSGMSAARGYYHRPLLGLRRSTLRAAALAEGLSPWDDPANVDPAFARTRVRLDVLPTLESALGPGVAEALARTATLLASDADALDGWAVAADPGGCDVDVTELAELPIAVRARVMRAMAVRAGAIAGALTARHVTSMEQLITDWHGQGAVALPGPAYAHRRCGRLVIDANPPSVLAEEN